MTSSNDSGSASLGVSAPTQRWPLVVLVPDRTGREESVQPLREFLAKQHQLQNAHFLVCEFSMSWGWSKVDLSSVCSDVGARIHNYYATNQNAISNIVLCGYSLGAMLARRVFLDASGFGVPADQKQLWASLVDRIVLVGAVCRGFHYSRLPWPHRTLLWIAAGLGLAKPLRSAFAGEPWASNVRLDWISFWQTSEKRPRVVNVRGSLDDIVFREDAVDIEKDPRAAYIEVAGDTHDSIIMPSPMNETLLLQAFLADLPHREPPFNLPKDRVYVLLHGMRSSKFFMAELEDHLRRLDPKSDVFRPSYGYISLFAFLSRTYRKGAVSKFTDQMIQKIAANPGARFCFAGHSNGTVIFGESMRRAPRMRFERAYFGGSALPRSFDLNVLVERRQLDIVRSDHCSKDWATGILARAIENRSSCLPFLRGIGSAGYDGFDRAGSWLTEPWFDGDHSGMFKHIDSIGEFLTARSPQNLPHKQLDAPGWFRAMHKYGDLIIPAAIVLYCTLVIRLLAAPFYPIPMLPEVWSLAGAAILLLSLLFVLLRF